MITQIEDVLTRLNGEDPRFLTGVLMELLQEFRKRRSGRLRPPREKAATRAEAEGGFSFERARRLWQVAADWHGIAKDTVAREAAMIRAAETHVKDAEEHAARPPENTPNLQAAMRMESAILALKKIGTPACTCPP